MGVRQICKKKCWISFSTLPFAWVPGGGVGVGQCINPNQGLCNTHTVSMHTMLSYVPVFLSLQRTCLRVTMHAYALPATPPDMPDLVNARSLQSSMPQPTVTRHAWLANSLPCSPHPFLHNPAMATLVGSANQPAKQSTSLSTSQL